MELIMTKHKQNIVDRLLSRTTKNEKDCWEWTGPKNNAGYGLMNTCRKDLKMATVHRIMMVEHVKSINYTDRVEVLHLCGNKLCVNPDHLKLGNVKDRHKLQKKHNAYNMMFKDSDYMWVHCEHCNTKTYRPHFERLHSNCKAKHK